jgi:pyruvate dehydrogenase E1 component alpha subunit
MYKYLVAEGLWSEEQEDAFVRETADRVKQTFETVEKSGFTPLEDIFDYVYAERTPILEAQYQSRKAFYEKTS